MSFACTSSPGGLTLVMELKSFFTILPTNQPGTVDNCESWNLFIVKSKEYLVLKIATSPTQAEQSFSFWCLMAQLTIDNLLVAAKTAKFQKSLSLDLFSFSYFGSNEIWHQFFVLNILWYLKESIDKNSTTHFRICAQN